MIDTLPYEFELNVNEQKYICLAQDKFIELDNNRLKLTTLIDITELKKKIDYYSNNQNGFNG